MRPRRRQRQEIRRPRPAVRNCSFSAVGGQRHWFHLYHQDEDIAAASRRSKALPALQEYHVFPRKTSEQRPWFQAEIAQGFLEYVDERRKLNKPLFYDPDRSRGGKPGNPQFKKVAERIGEWVHGLGIPVGVKPNHAWRHLFKSVARHVRMDREVEGFITGHRPKNSTAGNDYGDRWIKTMSAEIEKYPRFKIVALTKPPAPHKRHRRTDAEVAAAKAAKEKRKAARATRAAETK